MWGTAHSLYSSSVLDRLTIIECRGLEKLIHADFLCNSSCRPTCSVVPARALGRKLVSAGNLTNGRNDLHGLQRALFAKQKCARMPRQEKGQSSVTSKSEAVRGDDSQVRVGEEDVGDQILQEWVASDASEGNGSQGPDDVEVKVEKTGSNMRKIIAKILIQASLEDVWEILTDYERLADFIPGLAVSEMLEKRGNGARLYQVGEQDIALGVKFKAKAVVDCEEKPCEIHPNLVRRDIDFNTIEGDFQIFKGTWRIEQVSGPSTFVLPTVGGRQDLKTFLYYILDVQPKIWLPVALVEGRLTSEVKMNLVCIRDKAQRDLAK